MLIGLLLISVVISVINPQIVKLYVDKALDPGTTDFKSLILAAVWYITLAIIAQLLVVVSVYIGQNLAWDATNELRYDLLEHCLYLDMSFHNEHKPGSMVERIDGDILMLSTFFSTLILYLGRNVMLILSVLVGMFLIHWIFGLVFTIVAGLGFYFVVLSSKPAIKLWGDVREAASETYGYIEERITGKEDLLALGAKNYTMKGFHRYAKDHYTAGVDALQRTSIVRIVFFILIGVLITLDYIIGVPLVNLEGDIVTLGGLLVIAEYTRIIIDPIINVGFQIQELQRADASIDRVQELLNIKTKLADKGVKKFSDQPLSIIFNEVSFEYLKNEPVINNVNLEIKENTSLGLIGKTGSGKTTLSRLLFRLYEVKKGEIIVDGKNIREFPLKELRKQIAIVTQTVELFNGTLRDNITLFDRTISDQRVTHVIKDVGLESWLTNLDEGLDTVVNAGNNFSAGEAQLIAFARVFLRDPKIVILDEASSRLDPATEVLIDHAVEKLLQDRTAIIIAHRLSTLNQVNSIAILEKGEIIEKGQRSELEKDSNSKYSQLLATGLLEASE